MGLTVALIWTAFGITAGLAVVLLYLGLFQDRSRGRPRCPKCWYDMTGAPSLICPECGHDARSQRRLFRTRRRRWAIIGAVLMAACCYYSWLVRIRVVELKEPAAIALRPTCYLLATLPEAQSVQIDLVTARVRRFGVWPWEERLLLLGVKSAIAANPQRPWKPMDLLSAAARGSDWCLDRLVRMSRDSNTSGARYAFQLSAQFVRRLRDEQLTLLVDSAMGQRTEPYSYVGDPILLEMIRRKKPAFEQQFARWAADPPAPGGSHIRTNAEILTALRRMQGRVDPLKVFVTGPRVIECTTSDLPTVGVGVKNVDEGREAVGFTDGGTEDRINRGACLFDVRDEQGRQQLVRSVEGYSGRSTVRGIMLQSGQTVQERMDLDRYVFPLSPGRYRVTLFYSRSRWIAGRSDLSGTIVFSSEPFELIVKAAGADSRPASQPQ